MTYEERLQDIRERPEQHRHSFLELQSCCATDGAIDMGLMEAHEGLGASRRCDTVAGPCSCGGWH